MSYKQPPTKTKTNTSSSNTQPSKRVIVNKTLNHGSIPSQATTPVRASTPDGKPTNALSRTASTPALPTPQAVAVKKTKKPLVMDIGCGEDDIQIAVSNNTIAWYVEGEKLPVKSIIVDGKLEVERMTVRTRTSSLGQKQSDDEHTLSKLFLSAITEPTAKNALVDYLEEDNTLRVIMRLNVNLKGEACSAIADASIGSVASCESPRRGSTIYHLTALLDCAEMECRLSLEAYEPSFL